ncbi:MAG: ComF family protein [Lachnospiraceae bacterium]|nr:ComF family protein [Lachnospiraceae bacterium]
MSVVKDLLFPRRCPVCGDIVQPERALICPSCIPKLSPVRQPACRKCGKEVFAEHVEYCQDCSRHRRTFDSGAALLNYNETARTSMAAIKYKNKREYLDFYAEAMNHRFGKLAASWCPDVLVPVPVHPSRRRSRGFNQAEELAKRLSVHWEIPVDSALLIRSKKTAPQRDLSAAERLNNLQEAFVLQPSRQDGPIPGCVILIDDIYTTGSTIEACARILKQAGVQKIHFLTICIGGGR